MPFFSLSNPSRQNDLPIQSSALIISQWAALFIVAFSVALTVWNRCFHTYFLNRSFPVQLFLLAAGTALAVGILGMVWFFYLRHAGVRPFHYADLLLSLFIPVVWVALPYADLFNRGLVLTPELGQISEPVAKQVVSGLLRLLETIPLIALFRLRLDRRFFYIGLGLYTLVVLYLILDAPVVRRGDAFEYLYMTQAFQNHWTPNVTTQDFASSEGAIAQNQIPAPQYPNSGFFLTASGLQFSYHFWLYPLVVVPVKILLEAMGFNGLLAFQATNVLLFLSSLWSAAILARLDLGRRIAFTAFLALNPALWYLQWWSPEIFSYSFVIFALVAGTRKQYAVATVLAAFAATQNSPLLFLVGHFMMLGIFDGWPKGARAQFFHLVQFGLAFLPAALPYLFYLYFYQVPSLILANESGWKMIHHQKFLDFFLDWNMGILPYMPALLFLFILGTVKAVLCRSYRSLILVVMILVAVLSTTQTHNWNSDCAGLMRYATWMTPWMAFVILQEISLAGKWRVAWWGGLAFQCIVLASFGGVVANISYVRMTPMAALALNHAPGWYSPYPETFIERTRHQEIKANFAFYAAPNGSIRKILVDSASFQQFAALQNIAYQVQSPTILNQMAAVMGDSEGLRYFDFPDQTVRLIDSGSLKSLGAP